MFDSSAWHAWFESPLLALRRSFLSCADISVGFDGVRVCQIPALSPNSPLTLFTPHCLEPLSLSQFLILVTYDFFAASMQRGDGDGASVDEER